MQQMLESKRTTRRIGVLMGGWGEEREISLKSGEAVAIALESRGHDVVRVLAGPGLDQTLRHAKIEVAFIALHGRMGEDGKVQGLLEVLGIPYTGSGTLASAMAMNKHVAKKLFSSTQPRDANRLRRQGWPGGSTRGAALRLGLPLWW